MMSLPEAFVSFSYQVAATSFCCHDLQIGIVVVRQKCFEDFVSASASSRLSFILCERVGRLMRYQLLFQERQSEQLLNYLEEMHGQSALDKNTEAF
jgi:hypothetical protein